MHKKKVFIMMSGGVDSSVAAADLVEQGYDVVGVFIKSWSIQQLESLGVSKDLYDCYWKKDSEDARKIAKILGISFYVWNLEEEYKQGVVDYMIYEYKRGRTPNPDVMCNSVIKFGIFYKKAMSIGADYVATGHYCRTISDKKRSATTKDFYSSENFILRGLDRNKDQTYFLNRISSEVVPNILFPVGEYDSKGELRQRAVNLNLPTANKPDSQGICFIGQTPLRDILLKVIGKKDGDIIDTNGSVLGKHPGAFLYTIGQRNKLGLSGGPWFVLSIDIESNTVIVTHQDNAKKLYSNTLEAQDVNWLVKIADNITEFKCTAQIRYRQEGVECVVTV